VIGETPDWMPNGDEALQRVWGLVSIDGVAEEWTA
jgi:hypothetical protein